MKFYKVKKDLLKWSEMPQTDLPLRIPLLIDKDYNVLLGNCFKDRPNEYELVIIIEPWPYYLQVLPKLEKEIFDTKDPSIWLYAIDKELCEFLKDEVTINEQLTLLDFKETALLTEENYKRGGIYDFKKANSRHKDEIDDQLRLIAFEDDEALERLKKKEDDIVIDMEILKELL